MVDARLDIPANRRAAKYTKGVLVRRVLWRLATPLFRLSPHPLFGWRRFLLRTFGARVGRNVHVYNSAVVSMPWNLEIGDWSAVGDCALIYNLGRVTIGSRTTISQGAHICAGSHDYTRPDMPLLRPPISIGDQVWVCADAFVGPGLTVGDGAVVAARAVVVKDVEAWDVVAGNPAKIVKKRVLRGSPAPDEH
jgi:putative colanic acid biosynthesis acetyltransferase WcaF